MTVYQNQRHEKREKFQMPVRFSRLQEGDAFEAKMKNCSNDGICFVSQYPYLPDTRLFLKLGKHDDMLQADVRWCKPVKTISRNVQYQVGVHFPEKIDTEM